MALILDKTITGVTLTTVETGLTSGYTDNPYTEITYNESGYTSTIYFYSGFTGTTYVTGYTNLFIIDEYGNIHYDPYMVIDSIKINKFNIINQGFPITIFVFTYKDHDSRIEKRKPLYESVYTIDDESIYNEYFSINEMNESNIFRQAYKYIDTIFTTWKSDES